MTFIRLYFLRPTGITEQCYWQHDSIIIRSKHFIQVVKQLQATFPDAVGVRECGLYNADDYQIWEYARQNQYAVVTFDKDIPAIGSIKGFPPKVIWLRTGNLSNPAIISLFTNHLNEFTEFITNDRKGCLMIYLDSLPNNQIQEE